MTRNKIVLGVGAVVSVLCFATGSSFAQADAPAAAEVVPQDKPVSLASPAALQGSATVTALQAESGVHEVAESLKHLRGSARDIIIEVTRQDMVVAAEPDVIGPVVIPAVPMPGGMIGMGPTLPPRRKFLDVFISQMAQYYNLGSSDLHNLVVPEDKEAQIAPLWNESAAILQDMSSHYLKMLSLAQSDTLDGTSIGGEALAVYDDTTAFEKPWKQIYRILKEKK